MIRELCSHIIFHSMKLCNCFPFFWLLGSTRMAANPCVLHKAEFVPRSRYEFSDHYISKRGESQKAKLAAMRAAVKLCMSNVSIGIDIMESQLNIFPDTDRIIARIYQEGW
mmetsp:Transcript_13948/g.26595  ORF Transcript_13948/g.26595 Transcript_13948/m.26595 type:complete len:111 (+) Transcript_13948:270-602(+)